MGNLFVCCRKDRGSDVELEEVVVDFQASLTLDTRCCSGWWRHRVAPRKGVTQGVVLPEAPSGGSPCCCWRKRRVSPMDDVPLEEVVVELPEASCSRSPDVSVLESSDGESQELGEMIYQRNPLRRSLSAPNVYGYDDWQLDLEDQKYFSEKQLKKKPWAAPAVSTFPDERLLWRQKEDQRRAKILAGTVNPSIAGTAAFAETVAGLPRRVPGITAIGTVLPQVQALEGAASSVAPVADAVGDMQDGVVGSVDGAGVVVEGAADACLPVDDAADVVADAVDVLLDLVIDAVDGVGLAGIADAPAAVAEPAEPDVGAEVYAELLRLFIERLDFLGIVWPN